MWEAEIRKAVDDLNLQPLTEDEVKSIEKKILDRAKGEVMGTKAGALKILNRAMWRVAVGEAARSLGLYRRKPGSV